MTSQHTPGPWFSVDDHETRACLHVQSRDGFDLASVYDAPGDKSTQDAADVWRDDPARIANARLIAAGPELLDALEAVYREDVIPMGYELLREQVETAIAKATGVQP